MTASSDDIFKEAIAWLQSGRLDDAEARFKALLAQQPNNIAALNILGTILASKHRYSEAEPYFQSALKINSSSDATFYNYGIVLKGLGRPAEALERFSSALAINPSIADTWNNRGTVYNDLNRHEEAIGDFDKALALLPNHPDALCNKGHSLEKLKRYDQAFAAYGRALALKPNLVEAWLGRGNVSSALGRYDEAISAYEKAVVLAPNLFGAWLGRGNAQTALKRHELALAAYEKALALKPDLVGAWLGRGSSLSALKRYDEANLAFAKALALQPDLAEAWLWCGNISYQINSFDEAIVSYDKALAIKPSIAEAWLGRGNVFAELNRNDEASLAFDKALSLKPDLVEAWLGRGNVCAAIMHHDDALACYDRALSLTPNLAEAWQARGNVLFKMSRFDEAFIAFDKAFSLKPDLKYLEGSRLHTRQHICDWRGFESEWEHLLLAIRSGAGASNPFALIGGPSSPADQLKCAKIWAADKFPPYGKPIWQGERYHHKRIRIAYLSSDFRDHAAAHLLAGILEHHDKSQFEITAISWGPDDNSEVRARIKQSTEFIDVRGYADAKIAELIHGKEIDIVVDLMGFTQDSRTAILARRPAPIQLGFLGYPGTSGTNFMDYIIGDPIVLPFDRQPYYTEKVVHLPHSFMPTDSKQSVAREVPSRGDVGLPEEAFVFCSFSEGYKINPAIFNIWMRLLHDVAGSVLWLQRSNDTAITNLRHEAKARGIASDRLIFAPRLERPEHLARISLGDLFLNTHPVNAGANAIDALSVGLPIITTLGDAFVERATASLLHSVGLPDLVVGSFAEYEALARQLARDPAKLAEIKTKLTNNRDSCILFNTERFTQHIESAYAIMWKTWQRGEMPQSFSVQPIERNRKTKAP